MPKVEAEIPKLRDENKKQYFQQQDNRQRYKVKKASGKDMYELFFSA